VWEWCVTKGSWGDDKKPYPYQIEDEGTADYLAGGDERILRGGSWYNDSGFLRCAFRYYYSPNLIDYNWGLRCFVVPIF